MCYKSRSRLKVTDKTFAGKISREIFFDIRHRENCFNPLNAELNPICHLLALLGTNHILHVNRVRINLDY